MTRALPAVALALLVSSAPFAAAASDAADAEAVVTKVYYEGLPHDAAAAITPAGAQHLVAMLGDPQHAKFRTNILLALGISGHAVAYDALAAFGEAGSGGELESSDYRARRALPLAMGHLARSDDRALAWLAARARAGASDPGWRRGAMSGMRLGKAQRRAAITGLGLAARPEADAVLGELVGPAARAAADPDVARPARDALSLSARIRTEGPGAALQGGLRR